MTDCKPASRQPLQSLARDVGVTEAQGIQTERQVFQSFQDFIGNVGTRQFEFAEILEWPEDVDDLLQLGNMATGINND